MTATTSDAGLKPRDLVDLIHPTHVRVSPSASHVIYAAAPRGKKDEHIKSSLWLGEVAAEHSARQLTSGTYNDQMPQWCPTDDKTIAFVSDRGEVGKASAVHVMNVAGGEPYAVTAASNKRGISSFSWSPNGKFIAYASADEKTPEQERKEKEKDDVEVHGEDLAYARLRILNVDTRESKVLYTADEHVSGFGWSPDSKQIVFATVNIPDSDSPDNEPTHFKIVDLASSKVVSSMEFPGGINAGPVWGSDDILFLAGVTIERNGSSQAVYRAQVDNSASPYSLCTEECRGVDRCAAGLRQSGSLTSVKVEHNMLDEIEVLSRTSSSSDILKAQTHWSQAQHLADFDAIRSNEKIVCALVLSDASSPKEVFTKAAGATKPIQISTHGTVLSKHEFGNSTQIQALCYGETSVYADGYYVRPVGAPSHKPLPTFVNIHGGPYMRQTITFEAGGYGWTPYLVNAGYGILVTNYRGNSSKGDDYTKPSDGQVGTVEYEDILALVQKGVDDGFIDPEHIVVGGWSQGGFLTYLSAVRNGAAELPDGRKKTWRFKGAIAGAGVT